MTSPRAVVTGAYSNIGGAVGRELLARGWRVETLTNHPRPDDPAALAIVPHPLGFEPAALRRVLAGAHLLVNTYWIRFPRSGVTFAHAVRDTRTLLDAARDAGVRRLVQISVSHAGDASDLGYYRGKGQVECLVRESGLSYAIVRPTLVVGPHDVLTHHIAWLLRRLPWFGIPSGPGYRLQPVTLGDVARIVCAAAAGGAALTVDAAGPETFTFREYVGGLARAIGRPLRAFPMPPWAAIACLRPLGWALRDTILTTEELEGLRRDLLTSPSPPLGTERVGEWIARHGQGFGTRYVNDTIDRFARAQRARDAAAHGGA